MKFMVIVNRKYMVMVDAETNGGAEHRILDNHTGIESALAFDPVTESVNYAWAYEKCTVISYDELMRKSKIAKANRLARYNQLLDEGQGYENAIAEMEQRLAAYREEYADVKKAAEEFRIKYSLERGYTPAERIAELRNWRPEHDGVYAE